MEFFGITFSFEALSFIFSSIRSSYSKLEIKYLDSSRGLPTTEEVKFRVVDKVLIVLTTLIFIAFIVIRVLVEILGINVVYPYW